MMQRMDKDLVPFNYLNVTQVLGVINDNLFKLLLVFYLIQVDGPEYGASILALAGAVFVLPFLIFSVPAGGMADRISKQRIVQWTKVFEIFTAIVGTIGFWVGSAWILYLMLFLLAVQGAIFGPSKYSIVPELVPEEKLSKANGLLSSFTFLGIIIGTSLAGPLVQLTRRNFVVASFACILIAVTGWWTSTRIKKTPSAGSRKEIPWFFVRDVIRTYQKAARTENLLTAILGSAFFLFVGGYVQMNIIPYTIEALDGSDIAGSYYFLLTALGIGLGSLTAGKLSGKEVLLALCPFGALGMGLFLLGLGLIPHSLWWDLPLLFAVGYAGGLYLIPMDAYIQSASPRASCGENVAANNFAAFVGVLIASGLIWFFHDVLHWRAPAGFTVMGALSMGMTVFLFWKLRKEVSALVSG